MSTGRKLKKLGTTLLLGSALLWTGMPALANTVAGQSQRKAKKKQQPEPPPPLPSGPTGRPVPPIPLDSIAAVPPQVSYENNQLTIVAPNSTLADILRAVRKLTGAEIEIPAAPERVVTRLGPGPARDVIAELLNGSRFNYVLLGSPSDQSSLTKVVLVAKTGPQDVTPNPQAPAPQNQAENQAPEEPAPDAAEPEATEENANNPDDANAEQPPPEAAEQQPPQEQPQVKTPQQMLQEMQQRQMQLQQQQPAGQPPIPGASGMPPHPPQED
ncbi:MAG TPA: hypothetical protein VMU05_24095 [Dongiaceae bacterium]|nr:hypothetical protein [Dongiaceae bacterium]